MRFLFALTSACLFLVPILGLTSSCSKKTDEWRMPVPSLSAAGMTPVSVKVASGHTYPADTNLQFSNDYSKLEIETHCSFNGKIYSDRVSTSFRAAVALRLLWPKEMWEKLSSEQLTSSQCDLSFNAITENGSSQSFDLTAIQLSSFVASKPATLMAQASLGEKSLTLRALLDSASDYRLICGELVADLSAETKAPNLIELLQQKMDLRGTHSCHLLAQAAAGDGELEDYAMTNEFSLSFQLVPLIVKEVATPATGPSVILRSIEIQNKGAQSAYVKLSSTTVNINFRLVVSTTRIMESDGLGNSSMTAQFANANLIDGSGGQALLEIQAGQTALINFSLNSQIQSPPTMGGLMAYYTNVGLFFGLEASVMINELAMPNATDSSNLLTLHGRTGTFNLDYSVVFAGSRAQFGPEFQSHFPLGNPMAVTE